MDKRHNISKVSISMGRRYVSLICRERSSFSISIPSDDTPGCTAQACNLRDNYQELLDAGYHVLASVLIRRKSHLKFIEKYQLPIPLIADTEKKILQDYGVWGPKKFMGRAYDGVHRTSTFVVDERGVILMSLPR